MRISDHILPMGNLLDISGHVFGRLTAVERVSNKGSAVQWFCRCECGESRVVSTTSLRNGYVQSCGCRRLESWARAARSFYERSDADVTGRIFGRLTAVCRVTEKGKQRWKCVCECGGTTIAHLSNMQRGFTKSCGCLRRENTVSLHTTHGASRPRDRHYHEYTIWAAMKRRCSNEKCKNFPDYGGRGIYACPRWFNDFASFFSDMGERPKHMTIDRIDNDGSYTCGKCDDCIARGVPFNCRWATRKVQAQNRRCNVVVMAFGESLASSAWEIRTGVPAQVINERIRHGWSPEKAVSTPVRAKGQSSTKTHATTPAAASAMAAKTHGEDESAGAVPTVL